MLPTNAKVYFDQLCVARLADEASELARRKREFERTAAMKGWRPDSGVYAAGMGRLHVQSFHTQLGAIFDALVAAHDGFERPLDEGVDAQLNDWGLVALGNAFRGLETAYINHFQRFGNPKVLASGLSDKFALGQGTLQNKISQHLWQLRHVPMAQSSRGPVQPGGVQVIVGDGARVGAIQTGAGAIANVQQHWIEEDPSSLQIALDAMRDALRDRSLLLDDDIRVRLLQDVASAKSELGNAKPRKLHHLAAVLGGLAVAVQTIPALGPAWEAVKGTAASLGLQLP